MARSLNVSENVKFFIGACDFSSASTILVSCVTFSDSLYEILFLTYTGSAVRLRLARDASNRLEVTYDGTAITSTLTFTSADGWCYLAVTKPTGTASPTFYKITTSSLNSETPAGTAANQSTGATEIDVTSFSGAIHLAGIWDRVLTQDQIIAAAETVYGALMQAPKGLWIFDQDTTTQKIPDQTGNGANENTKTGTSVFQSPPNFSYGHPFILEEHQFAPPGRYIVQPPVMV
jgi:hypothetical protein